MSEHTHTPPVAAGPLPPARRSAGTPQATMICAAICALGVLFTMWLQVSFNLNREFRVVLSGLDEQTVADLDKGAARMYLLDSPDDQYDLGEKKVYYFYGRHHLNHIEDLVERQNGLLHSVREPRIEMAKAYELGHLPDGDYIEVATFGYDNFAAHMLWLRSIQAFGGLFRTPGQNFEPILHLFDVITDLEPRMVEAYEFGAMVIGEEAGNHEMTLQFLEAGMHKRPRQFYKIGYSAVFQCLFNAEDLERAKYFCYMTRKAHDAPDWIDRICIHIDEKRGLWDQAFDRWFGNYLTYAESNDQMMMRLQEEKSRKALMNWALDDLQNINQQFKQEQGRNLASLEELETSGYLSQKNFAWFSWTEMKDWVQRYREAGEPLGPNKGQFLGRTRKVGTLPEWTHDNKYGYMLNSEDGLIYKRDDMIPVMRQWLNIMRGAIVEYAEQHGSYPSRLTDLPSLVDDQGRVKFREPFEGEWFYDPDTGLLRSNGFPNM